MDAKKKAKLTDILPSPPKRNSAGKLLVTMDYLTSNNSQSLALSLLGLESPELIQFFPDTSAGWTFSETDQGPDESLRATLRQVTYDLLPYLQDLYKEVLCDLDECSTIPATIKPHIRYGLSSAHSIFFTLSLEEPPRPLSSSEESMLKMCMDTFPEEGIPSPDDIDRIRQLIDELRDLVADAKIPPALRRAILELNRLASDAINRHEIMGSRKFRKVFKSMVVEATEIFDEVDPSSVSSESFDILKNKVKEVIERLKSIVDVVDVGSKLLGFVKILLPFTSETDQSSQ